MHSTHSICNPPISYIIYISIVCFSVLNFLLTSSTLRGLLVYDKKKYNLDKLPTYFKLLCIWTRNIVNINPLIPVYDLLFYFSTKINKIIYTNNIVLRFVWDLWIYNYKNHTWVRTIHPPRIITSQNIVIVLLFCRRYFASIDLGLILGRWPGCVLPTPGTKRIPRSIGICAANELLSWTGCIGF